MGSFISTIDANFPPKAKWRLDDMPDLSNKIVIVTGGGAGIGKEITTALVSKGAKVYIASRDEAKSSLAIREIHAKTSRMANFLQLDLSSLQSVRTAALKFQELESRLDILINNAGVMATPMEQISVDGYDLQFATNALGHYYLTTLLLPQLEASNSSRVVNLTSHGYTLHPKINWDSLRPGPERSKMKSFDLYNQSKFMNIVFSVELARRYGDRGIISLAVHPGLIASNLSRNMPAFVVKIFSLFTYDTPCGALTPLYVATASEATASNGQYFLPWGRPAALLPEATDPLVGQKLWQYFADETSHVDTA